MDMAGPFPPGVWPGAEAGDAARRAAHVLLVVCQVLTPEEVAMRKANMEDARVVAGVLAPAEGFAEVERPEVDGEVANVLCFTMHLETKGSAEVISAMQVVVNEICRLFQDAVVCRIHGDRACELTGPAAITHF